MKFKHLIPSSSPSSSSSSSLSSIGFKRLRPLSKTITSLDLTTLNSPTSKCSQVQNIQDISPSGGMRWNPTQEQIRMLEALYCSGMRTPSAEQIDRITTELGRHGRIEGKNVFYWFQNHKARERQRQKRSAALLTLRSTPPPDPIMSLFSAYKEEKIPKEYSDGSCKRKCRSWNGDELLEVELELEDGSSGGTTLELFPLKPERGR